LFVFEFRESVARLVGQMYRLRQLPGNFWRIAMGDITQHLDESIRAACSTFESLHEMAEPMGRAVDAMVECLCAGRKLLVCGNGGSAADGADFSAEFGCRFVTDRRPYPALNLAQGGSLMSAIGNDYGYDEVFARQVAGLGQKGDVLVTITTSGNSRNILRALEEGKARGLTTTALLGRNGGSAKGLAEIELLVRSDSTARIQEAHKFILHVICGLVDARLPKA
jgi:D-sedoheptulose 7-phosphate isomerase